MCVGVLMGPVFSTIIRTALNEARRLKMDAGLCVIGLHVHLTQ